MVVGTVTVAVAVAAGVVVVVAELVRCGVTRVIALPAEAGTLLLAWELVEGAGIPILMPLKADTAVSAITVAVYRAVHHGTVTANIRLRPLL